MSSSLKSAHRDADQVADELGVGSGRRRRSSRRRQKASKKAARSRHIPEEVNMKVGDATMAYTMGRYEYSAPLCVGCGQSQSLQRG